MIELMNMHGHNKWLSRILRNYIQAACFLLILSGFAQAQTKEAFRLSDISFISPIDGKRQFYVELLPESFNNTLPHDMIIGLHGHGSDRWQFAKNERAECLAFRTFALNHNMIAISPDYRAKTSWMGPAAEADLKQIIKELKKKYQIGRVFLIGASMGGTAALTFAVLNPQMINGVTSMNSHANHLEFQGFQEAIAESFGGEKRNIPLEYKKRSAEYWPEKLTMPVALTAGAKDSIVPPNSVVRLEKVLKNLNHDVLMIYQPEGGHSTTLDDAIKAMDFMIMKNENRK